MKQKIKEAFIPILNRVRCLDKHATGNIKLAGMLVDALPKDILEAIERAKPKKPLNQFKRYGKQRGYCPSCDRILDDQFSDIACRCGQRLDWSEE